MILSSGDKEGLTRLAYKSIYCSIFLQVKSGSDLNMPEEEIG